MDTIQLDKPPRFLTHHIVLRPDCLARLTLPTQLSQQEANRISTLMDALVVDDDADADIYQWPFDSELNCDALGDDNVDPDGDLDGNEILASENALTAE